MFFSPINLYISENAEGAVQRKPTNATTRKPLLDRSVNTKSPNCSGLKKPNLNIPEKTTPTKKSCSPKLIDDLDEDIFTYSFKDVEDSYEDVWPKSSFGTENLIKILRNYCNVGDTPPPSPTPEPVEIHPIFFELPGFEMPDFELKEIPNADVDLPYFDDAQFDVSI